MPLPIHILQSATAQVYRRIASLAVKTQGTLITARTRHHSTLSSVRQFIPTQPKIHMSLPDKHTVHSSIPLRPTLTYALPPKPDFAVDLPVYQKYRSSDVEPQSYRPIVRHIRRDDAYRSRSPPRREQNTYISSSSSRSWRETDSYRARSRSPRRETDKYIPRSPTRRETNRYIPDRSPPPRRVATDRYSPVDDQKPLRTWTDSYRPDKLVRKREYSTSLSRSPEKRGRRLSTPDSRGRSRSVSSQRNRQSRKDTSTRRESTGKASKERAESQERPRFVYSPFRDERSLLCSDKPQKRPITPISQDRPNKVAKTTDIPSESQPPVFEPTSRVPSGPRLDRPLPTGPKSERNFSQAFVVSSQSAHQTQAPPTVSASQAIGAETVESDSEDMPSRGGRGRAPGPGKGGQGPRNGHVTLDPPMMDRARIIEKYGKNVVIKPEWAENPKSPLANHIGNKMAIKYEAQSGTMNGKKIVR
jgi:hypothetical protein